MAYLFPNEHDNNKNALKSIIILIINKYNNNKSEDKKNI